MMDAQKYVPPFRHKDGSIRWDLSAIYKTGYQSTDTEKRRISFHVYTDMGWTWQIRVSPFQMKSEIIGLGFADSESDAYDSICEYWKKNRDKVLKYLGTADIG